MCGDDAMWTTKIIETSLGFGGEDEERGFIRVTVDSLGDEILSSDIIFYDSETKDKIEWEFREVRPSAMCKIRDFLNYALSENK